MCIAPPTSPAHLPVLKHEESDILSVMNLILTKHGRRKILNPDACQLVAMDIVVLKIALHTMQQH